MHPGRDDLHAFRQIDLEGHWRIGQLRSPQLSMMIATPGEHFAFLVDRQRMRCAGREPIEIYV